MYITGLCPLFPLHLESGNVQLVNQLTFMWNIFHAWINSWVSVITWLYNSFWLIYIMWWFDLTLCWCLPTVEPTAYLILCIIFFTGRYDTSQNRGTLSSPIFMDNVACYGTESKLIDCTYHTDTSEDKHSEDIWINCGTPTPVNNTPTNDPTRDTTSATGKQTSDKQLQTTSTTSLVVAFIALGSSILVIIFLIGYTYKRQNKKLTNERCVYTSHCSRVHCPWSESWYTTIEKAMWTCHLSTSYITLKHCCNYITLDHKSHCRDNSGEIGAVCCKEGMLVCNNNVSSLPWCIHP